MRRPALKCPVLHQLRCFLDTIAEGTLWTEGTAKKYSLYDVHWKDTFAFLLEEFRQHPDSFEQGEELCLLLYCANICGQREEVRKVFEAAIKATAAGTELHLALQFLRGYAGTGNWFWTMFPREGSGDGTVSPCFALSANMIPTTEQRDMGSLPAFFREKASSSPPNKRTRKAPVKAPLC